MYILLNMRINQYSIVHFSCRSGKIIICFGCIYLLSQARESGPHTCGSAYERKNIYIRNTRYLLSSWEWGPYLSLWGPHQSLLYATRTPRCKKYKGLCKCIERQQRPANLSYWNLRLSNHTQFICESPSLLFPLYFFHALEVLHTLRV